MYKLVKDSYNNLCGVERTVDKLHIPLDPANTEYQEYLKWVEAGNTPLPSDYVDNPPE